MSNKKPPINKIAGKNPSTYQKVNKGHSNLFQVQGSNVGVKSHYFKNKFIEEDPHEGKIMS